MTPRLSVLLAASLSHRSMAGSGQRPAAIGANSQNRNAIVSPIGMRKGLPKSERDRRNFADYRTASASASPRCSNDDRRNKEKHHV